jgi:ATP-dependent Clp protease adapter protein ClpS
MPVTFSQNLERTLQRAASIAQEQGRSYATPEDLLIALIDDEDASGVMRASLIDLERLRHDVVAYMEAAVDEAADNPSNGPKFTADLHRVVRLAVIQVQSSGRQVLTGADMLVELFTEPVGHFLQKRGATRYDAVAYLSHGVARDASVTRPTAMSGAAPPEEDATARNAGDSARLEVVLLNDEYTPMEFVVWILEEIFQANREDATRIMLSTHSDGLGSCGVFGKADAAALTEQVENLARAHQHPLRCVMRPAPDPSAHPPAAKPGR